MSNVNVELTSRCNKNCWMCGRRRLETTYPEIVNNYGDMRIPLVSKIANELPNGVVVQFHNNGEPLLYPNFGTAVAYFERQIKCVDTNAILLYEKRDEVVDNLDTLTISVIAEDEAQYETVVKFLEFKRDMKPLMVYRILGDVPSLKWEKLPGLVVHRTLHHPMGSFGYQKKVVKPEIGICLEVLHHLAIDRFGDVSVCVRFDPDREGVIGNVNEESIDEIWNGWRRAAFLDAHLKGDRNIPLCCKCEYWGVPTG